MRKTTAHLDRASILRLNADILAEAERHPSTFRGPQMTFHRKPNGGGGPCDVCGCLGLRIGVMHRALGFGEAGRRAKYVKHSKHFSGDYVEEHLDADGVGVT